MEKIIVYDGRTALPEIRPGDLDPKAMQKLSYGLFVLTAAQGCGKGDNGCIINTATQLTTAPERISICVNKNNLTHDMILETGKFNLSVLSEKATFELLPALAFRAAGPSINLQTSATSRAHGTGSPL